MCPFRQAKYTAVFPSASRALTSAPFSISSRTTCSSPLLAAQVMALQSDLLLRYTTFLWSLSISHTREMSHSFTAVIRLLLGQVRPAIRAATRGIHGLRMATSWGEGTGNLFLIASLLGDVAPALERPDEICDTEASRRCALSPTLEAICTPIVRGNIHY